MTAAEELELLRELSRISYLHPSVPGADSITWSQDTPLTAAERMQIETAQRICIEYLKAHFNVAMLDNLLRLRHGLDTYERSTAILLDRQFRLLDICPIAQGSPQSVQMPTHVIACLAIEANAAFLVLVHSHPAGVARPSAQDLRHAKAVSNYLPLIDVKFADDMIVAGPQVFSMIEHGVPPGIWPALSKTQRSAAIADAEPILSATDSATLNLALATVASHQSSMPRAMLDDIIAAWMGPRINACIAGVSLDLGARAISAKIVAGRRLDNRGAISLFRYAIESHAAAFALVVHRPRGAMDSAQFMRLSRTLAGNLKAFDVNLIGAYRTGAINDSIEPEDWKAETDDNKAVAIAAAANEGTLNGTY